MSQPFTTAELDAIAKSKVGMFLEINDDDFERLIAAARTSIPRPISEAPRDGTWIVGRDLFGCWHVCSLGNLWADKKGYERILDIFIPIPKGGAS